MGFSGDLGSASSGSTLGTKWWSSDGDISQSSKHKNSLERVLVGDRSPIVSGRDIKGGGVKKRHRSVSISGEDGEAEEHVTKYEPD